MRANRKALAIAAITSAVVVIVGVAMGYYFSVNQPRVVDTTTQEINDVTNPTIPRVLPANSTLDGLTYSEWTARWWQWLVSVPLERNPAADSTGEFCAENQNGPVWFLPGTFGGPVERTCDIPAGKAILIVLVNSECNPAEYPDLQTESELRSCAKAGQDSVNELFASIDGVQLKETDLRRYRVDSPLFNLTFPENNIFALPPQTVLTVSDGYWVLLEPLSLGNHEIHFRASIIDATDPSGAGNFVSEARYHITVR